MSEKSIIRIINARICGPDAIHDDRDVVIHRGRIQIVPAGQTVSLPGKPEIHDARHRFLLPAFTDIHNHGAGLFDVTAGRFDPATQLFELTPELYQEGLHRYCSLMASSGTANLFAGIMACGEDRLRMVCRQIRTYLDAQKTVPDGSILHGVFLEGTFLNPAMAGIQNPEYSFRPDVDLFEKMNGEKVLRIVNVVPDYDEDSLKLIGHLTDHGITTGMGHTAATGVQIVAAVKYGLKYCIHFTNGPMSQSFKPFAGGGAIEGALTCPDLSLELLADGYHVNRSYLRDTIARKGLDKVFASTDSMFAAQTEEVTEFSLSGVRGEVSRDRDYVFAQGHPGWLFGSMLRMDVAFGNIVSLLTDNVPGIWYAEHPAMAFEDAVAAAGRICATNVNRMLREDGHEDLETGEIADGKWADLIIGDITGKAGAYQLHIHNMFVRGKEMGIKHD